MGINEIPQIQIKFKNSGGRENSLRNLTRLLEAIRDAGTFSSFGGIVGRIRTIKPEFFLHEKLAELLPLDRLLYVGLWCIADKSGRLKDRYKTVKAQTLPFDDHDVDKALTRLHSGGFIVRYHDEADKYIQISNWLKHQRPHHTEKESELPANGGLTVMSPLKDGEEPEGREGKGREGKGREGKGREGKGREGTPPARPIMSEEEFWKSLQENPAYRHIDFEVERGKMDAWLALPKNRNRKLNRQFVLNWLGKIEKPLNSEKPTTPSNMKGLQEWVKERGIA